MSGQLPENVEKLEALRADLQAGIASLDAGKGKKLDMRALIALLHVRYAEPKASC